MKNIQDSIVRFRIKCAIGEQITDGSWSKNADENYDPVNDLMIAVRRNINEAIREEAERRSSRS